jgi:hypothetical protein
MRIETDSNLVFDTKHPRCSLDVTSCQGEFYAFVSALDVGPRQAPLDEARQARYWGKFSWRDQEGSVLAILERGGKWPTLSHGNGEENSALEKVEINALRRSLEQQEDVYDSVVTENKAAYAEIEKLEGYLGNYRRLIKSLESAGVVINADDFYSKIESGDLVELTGSPVLEVKS